MVHAGCCGHVLPRVFCGGPAASAYFCLVADSLALRGSDERSIPLQLVKLSICRSRSSSPTFFVVASTRSTTAQRTLCAMACTCVLFGWRRMEAMRSRFVSVMVCLRRQTLLRLVKRCGSFLLSSCGCRSNTSIAWSCKCSSWQRCSFLQGNRAIPQRINARKYYVVYNKRCSLCSLYLKIDSRVILY